MRRKFGVFFMILGTALVLMALSLFLWNRREERKAGAATEEILPRLIERIPGSADTNPYDTEMPEVELDGDSYIGYVSLPSLGLELPVMSDWSYPKLQIAPCRYFGSAKTDDLVIAAHNYAGHFGKIDRLSVGDQVYFTDMDGEVFLYEAAEIDLLSPDSVEEMTAGDYALTLFTCTYSGKSRVTVRCCKVED